MSDPNGVAKNYGPTGADGKITGTFSVAGTYTWTGGTFGGNNYTTTGVTGIVSPTDLSNHTVWNYRVTVTQSGSVFNIVFTAI